MNVKILGITRHVWCHISAASVAVFIVVPITFMALERADPVTIHSQALSGDFTRGGRVTLTWEATATKYCEGHARARIISSHGIVHEYEMVPTVIRSRNGERGTYSLEFVLPKSIDAGPAIRESHVSYYCNPLQWWFNWPIRVVRQYGPFDIVDKPR